MSNRSRPNISYAVGRLSSTQVTLLRNWTALERVFKYLRGIIGYYLTYTGYLDIIEGYSDVNWVTDSNNSLLIVQKQINSLV